MPSPRKPATPSDRNPNRDLVPTARVTGGTVPSSTYNEHVSGLYVAAPRGLDAPTRAAEVAERGFDVGARYIKVRPIKLDPADPRAAVYDWQQTLTHELAHAFDFERSGRTHFAAEHDPAYAAAIQTDGREISGYGEHAKHDPSEDFAEAYSLYVLVQGTPRETTMRALYPNRFAYLDRVIASAQ